MAACPALASSADFLASVFEFIDCESRTLGAQGYAALAAPGSSFSLILTALLSLFVALFGYRMLLGQVPTVRDGVLAVAKLGLVLALATGWSAYRTIFYDVAFDAPAQLASEIGAPAGLLDGSSLAERLQRADRSLVYLAVVGTGEAALTPQARMATGVPPPPFGGFEAFALGTGRAIYLTGAVAAFGSVRLVAGLLLALGPFFIAFLLFGGTRGLFEGWLRVLIGSALGALATAVTLSIELALLEPRLADWLARRALNLPVPGAAAEVLAISLIFALMLLAVLFASVRVARGLRLPTFAELVPSLPAAVIRHEEFRMRAEPRASVALADESRRAAEVANAVAATQRREAARRPAIANEGWQNQPTAPGRGGRDAGPSVAATAMPIGQSFRRPRNRVSASAGRRDKRT